MVSITEWSQKEQAKSSTWREFRAVVLALVSFRQAMNGKSTLWRCDNQAVPGITRKGSMVPELQEIAMEVAAVCEDNNIGLEVIWVPREENEEADALSRYRDWDDWAVSQELLDAISAEWEKPTVDAFGSQENAKIEKFYSRWWWPGTAEAMRSDSIGRKSAFGRSRRSA
jgi:hypothetical protein